jgi:hypothetical protein
VILASRGTAARARRKSGRNEPSCADTSDLVPPVMVVCQLANASAKFLETAKEQEQMMALFDQPCLILEEILLPALSLVPLVGPQSCAEALLLPVVLLSA